MMLIAIIAAWLIAIALCTWRLNVMHCRDFGSVSYGDLFFHVFVSLIPPAVIFFILYDLLDRKWGGAPRKPFMVSKK